MLSEMGMHAVNLSLRWTHEEKRRGKSEEEREKIKCEFFLSFAPGRGLSELWGGTLHTTKYSNRPSLASRPCPCLPATL